VPIVLVLFVVVVFAVVFVFVGSVVAVDGATRCIYSGPINRKRCLPGMPYLPEIG
jgi:hypothetical protein